MKYNNISDLDNKVERTVKRIVKHYYSDWKNYDRIKYMALKGKKAACLLMIRDCGTYIFNVDDVKNNAIVEYYTTQQIGSFYLVDTKNYSFQKLDIEKVKGLHKSA